MKRLPHPGASCFLLIALLVSGCSSLHENFLARLLAPKSFEVGLWVQAEGANRTLDSAEKIQALVKRSCAAGVTDIYAQVYRSGRAWFPTKLADDSPSRRAGQDPLALLLDLASRDEVSGCAIRVHAWINAFALARNNKAPIIRELGKDAVLKDQHGRSLLEYPFRENPHGQKVSASEHQEFSSTPATRAFVGASSRSRRIWCGTIHALRGSTSISFATPMRFPYRRALVSPRASISATTRPPWPVSCKRPIRPRRAQA